MSKETIVDNTILKATLECSTRAAGQYVMGLATVDEAAALRAGSAVHVGLASRFQGNSVVEALRAFDDDYLAWANEHVEAGTRLSYKRVRSLLSRWFDSHPLDEWALTVDPKSVEQAVHASFGEIKGHKVRFVALLDGEAKRRVGGVGTSAIDHKTGKSLTQYWKDRQEDSSQFSGQMWVAKENNRDYAGVWINGIELPEPHTSDRPCPTHKPKTYQQCSMLHARDELFMVQRTKSEIEAWEVTARRGAAKFIRLLESVEDEDDLRALPMEGRFTGACGLCQFRDWCNMGRPRGGLKGFTVRHWNPLEQAELRGA